MSDYYYFIYLLFTPHALVFFVPRDPPFFLPPYKKSENLLPPKNQFIFFHRLWRWKNFDKWLCVWLGPWHSHTHNPPYYSWRTSLTAHQPHINRTSFVACGDKRIFNNWRVCGGGFAPDANPTNIHSPQSPYFNLTRQIEIAPSWLNGRRGSA